MTFLALKEAGSWEGRSGSVKFFTKKMTHVCAILSERKQHPSFLVFNNTCFIIHLFKPIKYITYISIGFSCLAYVLSVWNSPNLFSSLKVPKNFSYLFLVVTNDIFVINMYLRISSFPICYIYHQHSSVETNLCCFKFFSHFW